MAAPFSIERDSVPRKPNYRFDRSQRDQAKAKKKAERLEAKLDRREQKKPDDEPGDKTSDEADSALPSSELSD